MHLADPSFSEALSDRYLLLRELGAGGMATVYLAEDVKHHRKVAVKVLRAELAVVLGAERFLKEIEVTANLQHPHILPLFDSGVAGSRLFYVMPYIEGETLRVRLTREKQLPVAEAVRIASEAASALDYAHRHGLIHRDVKPENILLHDGRALVADFGIALAVSRAGGARVTETQMTVHAVTPDGRTGIAARVSNPGGTGFDLVTVPLAGSGPSRPILESSYDEDYPALSPDGRWLAYVSTESNQAEVYLRPFPGEGAKVRVSQNGGTEPVWSRNGKELFYRSLGPREPQLMSATIEVQPTLRVASRTPLFDVDEYESAVPHANYDVMPDGRFLMVRLGRRSEFVYLQHWTALLPKASASAP